MLKRIISILLSVVILTSNIVLAETENTAAFADTQYHWARADIEYLFKIGIVSGVSDTVFEPDSTVTRAEYITMIVRGLELTPDIYSVHYSDVAVLDDWFSGYIGAAINAGIIEDSQNAFLPYQKITRCEVALITAKAAEYLDYKADTERKIEFTDISEISEEEQDAVNLLTSTGIIYGADKNTFNPDSNITRAESAAVVKRFLLNSNSVKTLSAAATDACSVYGFTDKDGTMYTKEEYSHLEYDGLMLSGNINAFEAELAATGDDMRLEIWANSMDPLAGTLIGTLYVKDTGGIGAYDVQKTLINKTYGDQKLYVRFVGSGEISIKNVAFFDDTFTVDINNYSAIQTLKWQENNISGLDYGGYIKYSAIEFGAGFDTIEVDLQGIGAGMIEVYTDDITTGTKVGVIETKVNQTSAKATVVKCRDTHDIILKPITKMSGSITGIRFTNDTVAADILLEAENAITDNNLTECTDFNGTEQTDAMFDGDVLKFEQVRMGDGYNFLDMRIENANSSNFMLSLGDESQNIDAGLIGFGYEYEEQYFEIRLDSQAGDLIGIIKKNPVEAPGKYDTQSCGLTNASGVHDVYVKAVGNIGWKINWIKLKCQGYYDRPFVSIEAEDSDSYIGTVTDANDSNRFAGNTIEQESSGRRTVKLSQDDSYINIKVPEWFEGGENVAITVRNSIPDVFNEKGESIGQTGEMEIYVNGERRSAVIPYNRVEKKDTLHLSNEFVYGRRTTPNGAGLGYSGEYASLFYDDASCIIEGEVKAGDIIRLKPQLNDKVTYCYVDMVDLEKIDEAKVKPEYFISIEDFGAVANDGKNDADAFRRAIDTVKNNPEKWAGVWIPDGLWEMSTFNPDGLLANVEGVRILGSGMWSSRIFVDYRNHTTTGCNHGLCVGTNTLLWDFALFSTSLYRDQNDPRNKMAISSNGVKYGFNMQRLWVEHWSAGVWGMHITGVLSHNRMKNLWSDGINVLAKLGKVTDGATVEHNYVRGTGDDGIATFAPCEPIVNLVDYYKVRLNTVSMVFWGNGITFWGAERSQIENNYINDIAFFGGIAASTTIGVNAARMFDDVVIKGNRLVRCGGNAYGHDNGAINITLSWKSEVYNTKLFNTYIQKNDILDSPYELLYVYSASLENSDEILPDISYNYIRNVCLSKPGDEVLNKYDTSAVHGGIVYRYNIAESKINQYLASKTTLMKDTYVGNYPNSWGEE